jgi:alkylhydroperoxidase family enzyme
MVNKMAWIEMIPEEEATGRLKELYAKYTEPWGGVDNIMKIHSLNAKSMQTHFDLYAHLMRGRSDLTRVQREMIAVVVSAVNRCHY